MSPADAPHRDPSRESEPSSSRDQRIEQLLLAGLDRYFAGELERAIQVWSRVFFLDRGHPRARAYIERARAAIAEGQREAEARGHRLDAGAINDDDGVTPEPAGVDDSAVGLETFSSRPSPVAPTSLSAISSTMPPGAVVGNAVVARPALDFEDLPDAPDGVTPPPSPADERARRSRTVAQALLVALAALLLFGAGYVVAARDRLAGWWAPSGEPVLAVPAMAPESGAAPRAHEPPAGSTTPSRGPASR
jgi:hypothetical protein